MTAATQTQEQTPDVFGPLRRTAMLYAAFCVLCVAVFWDTAVSLVDVWWSSPTYNHGFFVAPMAIYLVWIRRHNVIGVPIRQEWLALPLILGATLFWLIGYAGDIAIIQHMGFVGILICAAGGLFGRHMVRKIWFPILFLGFMVPAGEQLVPPLQDITADFSVIMLEWVGIPVWRDGIFLQIPTGMFEVAEACAGVRFLIANVVVATVFAYLAYDKWWKWGLFITFSIVMPIFANGVRAFGIIYIAYATDHEYAVGVDHLVYGWGFFTVIMLICLFVGNLFADRRVGEFPQSSLSPAMGKAPMNWVYSAVAAALLLIGPAYGLAVVDSAPWQGEAKLASPTPAQPWRTTDERGPSWRPVFVGAEAELYQTYTDGTNEVAIYVSYYPVQGQGAEVVYHANRMANDEQWKRVETQHMRLSVDGKPMTVRLERMKAHPGIRRVAANWYWIAGRFTSDPIEAKLLQVSGALLSGDRAAAGVVITMLEPENPETIQATMQRFLDATPGLGQYLANLVETN